MMFSQSLGVGVIFSNSQPTLTNMASVSIVGRENLKPRNKICLSKFPVSTTKHGAQLALRNV